MKPIDTQTRARLDSICRNRHVRTLYVFGSAAREDFNPDESDVDFVVSFQSMPPGDLADAYFGLLNDLEVLFGRPVDLITDASIENPRNTSPKCDGSRLIG